MVRSEDRRGELVATSRSSLPAVPFDRGRPVLLSTAGVRLDYRSPREKVRPQPPSQSPVSHTASFRPRLPQDTVRLSAEIVKVEACLLVCAGDKARNLPATAVVSATAAIPTVVADATTMTGPLGAQDDREGTRVPAVTNPKPI